jgi:hypothetical protein
MRCETAGSASTGFTVLGGFAGCTELTLEHLHLPLRNEQATAAPMENGQPSGAYWTVGSRAQMLPKVYGAQFARPTPQPAFASSNHAVSFMEEQTMKKHMGALCTLALLSGSLSNLFAQGRQPSQPVDPTAQAPATPAPTTPPTFPPSEARAREGRADVKVYMGTIVTNGDAWVLKSGNEQYLLDSQKKAKNYKGKDVEVTGTLDKEKHLIHVEKIRVSPSM